LTSTKVPEIANARLLHQSDGERDGDQTSPCGAPVRHAEVLNRSYLLLDSKLGEGQDPDEPVGSGLYHEANDPDLWRSAAVSGDPDLRLAT
jgi:hypothetical protein